MRDFKDEARKMVAPQRHESLIPRQQDKSPRIVSWSDPNDLTQLLDFFTTPPMRTAELPKQLSYGNNSSASDVSTRKERVPFKGAAMASQSSPRTPTNTVQWDSPLMDAPRKVPLKAQRLMGLDTDISFHRSTFDDWEDEEHLQSAVGSPQRRSIIRRSKQDSKLPSVSNRDSKWTTLSQRFRNNSTTPVSLRLRNSASDSFDDAAFARSSAVTTAAVSDPTNSMMQPLVRPSFGLEQRKVASESRVRTISDRNEWAEARASSRALNSSIDSFSFGGSKTSPTWKGTRDSSDSTNSDIPVQIIRATPPLRFNPNRRPRAPFPPAEQFDSSSADESKGPDKVLPLTSPVLARCPSKMLVPSRIMRPSPTPPAKTEPMPPRPRRPTEGNIFAEKTSRSPIKSASPGRRMMSTPPRPPPPSIPVPPLPPLNLTKASPGGKTEGLKVALGVQACSPLRSSSGDKEFLQTSPETSPQTVIFCGEKVAQAFTSTIKLGQREMSCGSEDEVELIVGGVTFEAPLCLLLGGQSKVESSGLAASLRKHIDKQEQERLRNKSSSLTLSVPIYSPTRRSKNTVNSYDEGNSRFVSSLESPSSSEDESEEGIVPVFAYDTTDMTWTHHQVKPIDEEEDCLSPVQTLLLPSPLRNHAHAHSPTSVSSDRDDSVDGEELDENEESGSSDIMHLRRTSATPELIGPNTFIFTSSPPTHSFTTPTNPSKYEEVLQVVLHRDPQVYPFVLHYLKKASLPSYFSEERFPLLERQRALQRLCLEARWLGYSGLADKCNEALDASSNLKMLSVLQR